MKSVDSKALDRRWTRVPGLVLWYGLYLAINIVAFHATEGGPVNAVLCPILLWAAAESFYRIRRLSKATPQVKQCSHPAVVRDSCSCCCHDNSLHANTGGTR